MSDVYLLQRGVSKSKPTTSYLKEIGDKIEEIRDVSKHNHEVGEEYKKGQEGVDYNYANPESDPRFLTQRKIKKMFKGQLEPKEFDEKKFKDPKSKQAEFERNRNRIFNLNIKKSEIKEYPGSPNGKLPEEDKAFYSNWYMSNRPESLKSIEEEVINPIIEANRRKVIIYSLKCRFPGVEETKRVKKEHTNQTNSTTSSNLANFIDITFI